MKKLYLLVIILLAVNTLNAQSTRLVLAEEFTNAGCGPCASQNPGFNTLLQSNPTKIVSIKYQTPGPGYDPMNIQTSKIVNARMRQYPLTGVPNAFIDGVGISNDCNAYANAPACLSAAEINVEYSKPSPFTINLSHVYNMTYDSIYVTAEVICTQAIAGPLVLQVVMVEDAIRFASAPGTNGETVFYDVMRKMLPDTNGTSLSTTWAVGQTQTFNFVTEIPSYIYDKHELSMTAFIQNTGTKAIHQAAHSEPVNFPNDASIQATTSSLPPFNCDNTWAPSITLTNKGDNAIFAADFNYSINGGTPAILNWTGSLAPGANTSVVFPALNLIAGENTFNANIASVNTGSDLNNANDAFSSIALSSTFPATLPPLSEGFAGTSMPAKWLVGNGGSEYTWSRNNYPISPIANRGSLRMDFYLAAAGDVDMLYLPKVDLTNANSPMLNFKVSKAQYVSTGGSLIDKLELVVSTNCGQSWIPVWVKQDPQLATVAGTTTSFTPSNPFNAAQWRTETVDLTAFIGNAEVNLAFKATSGNGNNLHLDDINLSTAVGVNENSLAEQVSLYPVPSNGDVYLNLDAVNTLIYKISITDAYGKLVHEYNSIKTSNLAHIDMTKDQSGVYFVKIEAGNQVITKKVVLDK